MGGASGISQGRVGSRRLPWAAMQGASAESSAAATSLSIAGAALGSGRDQLDSQVAAAAAEAAAEAPPAAGHFQIAMASINDHSVSALVERTSDRSRSPPSHQGNTEVDVTGSKDSDGARTALRGMGTTCDEQGRQGENDQWADEWLEAL